MPTPEQLMAGHQAATDEIRSRVLAFTSAVWANSPAFRDADIQRIVRRIVPVVQSGQLQVARITNAYIGQMSVLAGVSWSPGVDPAAITDYRGVPAGEVYRRPAVTTYTALSKGTAFPDAVLAGAARLASIVGMDMQQAKNRQSARSLGGSGFKFYERRLTGRENCAFCAIASTQRYLRGDLMPIHPGCDCGVFPFMADRDPGQVLNHTVLEQVHAAIDTKLGGTDRGARDLGFGKTSSAGRPLSDFTELIVTNQHGELGPILGWRSDNFTGPSDLS